MHADYEKMKMDSLLQPYDEEFLSIEDIFELLQQKKLIDVVMNGGKIQFGN